MANQGRADIFAMKFAATGELRGAWQAGTTADNQAPTMAVAPCGGVFVGGYTSGTLVPGHPSAGRKDMCIVRAMFASPVGQPQPF